ncbi:MAG: hypothetical protein CFK52_01130 [Chloracidobacterium sp. CP2_5A]|nr:MAG: hypothetical protein CFK52_01130 [Chloracidobacterium sp. CP2_5A]
MQRSILTLTLLAAAGAVSVSPAAAQTMIQQPIREVPIQVANAASLPEQFIVSAKAGTVNFVEGAVANCRAREADAWRPVTTSSRLKAGDRLRTGADGRAELLLNPGSYLRLDREAEIVLTNPNLDALTIEVARGSALFEVTGTDGTELFMRILTRNGAVNIARNGLYRVTVPAEGAATVAVIKGRIAVEQAGKLTLVKDKQLVTLDAATMTAAKLDKNAQDDFDAWSRNRAKALRDANSRLKDRDVLAAFNGWRQNGAYGFGYAPFFGLWLFDGRLGGYTFFPFYGFWNSPYGFGYGTSWGLPWEFYRPTLLPMTPNAPIVAGARQAPASAPPTPSDAPLDPRQPGHEPVGEMSGQRLSPTPPGRSPLAPRPTSGLAGDDDYLPALPRRELPSPVARPALDAGGYGKPGYEPPMGGGIMRGGMTPDYGGPLMRGGYGGDAGTGVSPGYGGGMRTSPPARAGGEGSPRSQSPVVE